MSLMGRGGGKVITYPCGKPGVWVVVIKKVSESSITHVVYSVLKKFQKINDPEIV